VGVEFVFHPLIHTFPLADLTQDIVVFPKWQKCGLKYVMFTFRRRIGGSTSERLNEARNGIVKSANSAGLQKMNTRTLCD
jgi:hypothetical protein